MRIYNYENIIPAGTVLNANINGKAMQALNMMGVAVQVVVTGTPTGTFSLQGSNDAITNSDPTYVPTNWTTLSSSNTAFSAAGVALWNVPDMYFTWIRLVYTDGSSGSSTAVVAHSNLNAKGF